MRDISRTWLVTSVRHSEHFIGNSSWMKAAERMISYVIGRFAADNA